MDKTITKTPISTVLQDIPVFHMELETHKDQLRIRIVSAPDGKGASDPYHLALPLQTGYSNTKELGQALYNCLFADATSKIGERFQNCYQDCCEQSPEGYTQMRLLLEFCASKTRDDPVVSWPWELLHDGKKWLACDSRLSIVRKTAQQRSNDTAIRPPLRVLLAVAEPQQVAGLATFNGDQLLSKLTDVLQAIQPLDLETLPHATIEAFKAKLKQGFHIVHFLGHGDTKLSSATGIEAWLHFEDQDRPEFAPPLEAQELKRWFDEEAIQPPKLMLLTACQSGISDRFATRGFAQAMHNLGIHAVVAMQARLLVEESEVFAAAFYTRLAERSTVDDAIQAGRQALNNPWSFSKRAGTEEIVQRLLYTNQQGGSWIAEGSDADGAKQNELRVIFHPWAVPMLFLNGSGRLGLEAPSSVLHWRPHIDSPYSRMIYVPEHRFYIDKYPVTCREYQRFITADGRLWNAPTWKDDDDGALPATNMSWQDAEAYAKWAGKQLPTVEQWQQAALSGYPDRRRYPSGDESPSAFYNTRERGLNRPIPVQDEDEHNCNPQGMCGLVGNVAEWALSSQDQAKICGGSYKDVHAQCSILTLHDGGRPNHGVGFRCVAFWPDVIEAQRIGKVPRSVEGE